MFNLSKPVLKEIELPNAAGSSVGAIVTMLRLKFPIEPTDRGDDELEEAVRLMVNPPRKAPSLSRQRAAAGLKGKFGYFPTQAV